MTEVVTLQRVCGEDVQSIESHLQHLYGRQWAQVGNVIHPFDAGYRWENVP